MYINQVWICAHSGFQEKAGLRLSLLAKALFLILVPLTFEIALVSLMISVSNRADHLAQRLQDSQAMVANVDRALRNTVDLAMTVSSLNMSNDARTEQLLKTSKIFEQQCSQELDRLKTFARRYNNRKLALFVNQCWTLLDRIVASLDDRQKKEILNKFDKKMPAQEKTAIPQMQRAFEQLIYLRKKEVLLSRVARLADEFLAAEEKISSETSSSEQRLRLTSQILLVGGIVANLFIAWWLNQTFNRSIARRLSILMENSERIAQREALKPAEPSSDEIGVLDEALHRLARELEAARVSERAAVDHAVDMICSISENRQFSEVSPSALANLGYLPGELTGIDCLSLAADDSSKQALADGLSGARLKEGGTAETVLKRKNMENGCFMWSVFWSEDDRGYFCVVHDITARKKAEEALLASELRMHSLVDKMPAGLVAFDAQEKIETVNEFMGKMLDCPASSLSGKRFADLFEPESYQLARPLVQAATDRDVIIRDVRMRRPESESSFPVEALVTGYKSEGSLRQIAVIQDMSEPKELDRVKREFLATLTHDIRTPLSSIRASLNMLSEGMLGDLSETGMNRVNKADRAASELIELINGVLEIARLDAGKQQEQELVDLHELCHDLFADLNNICLERSIKILHQLSEGSCLGNLEKLYRALEIFARRSIGRTPSGSHLGVILRQEENLIRLEIADGGPEISESESFQIMHGGATEDTTEGAAELALARAIIKAHGGHIIVGRTSTRGAAISIMLPAAPSGGGTAA